MLVTRNFGFLARRMLSVPVGKEGLFEKDVTFNNSSGENIQMKAIYQDTLPSGSSIGTVVGLHGAPGSHKDFKYISPLLANKSIRFIGINYPGFGVTPDHEKLKFNNVERHEFVSNLMEQLKIEGKVVFLGHSRGTENAIMLGSEKAYGIVLLNPTGLRIHRGIRPYWFLQVANALYNVPLPGLRVVLEPLFFQLYKIVKLKVPDGHMAAHCMQTMEQVALGRQKPFIDRINNSNVKVLFCYAGKDWLIENEISQECAQSFEIEHFHSKKTEDRVEEESILSQADSSFKRRGCSVFFEADGHFLQRDRAQFVANAIEKMLKTPLASKI